jgi:hypothetical protein
MKYYINKQIRRALVFSVAMPISRVGTTQEDYQAGKFIEITQTQANFYTEHPNASFSEIINMEMNEIVIPEIPIEERYRRRVEQILSEKYTYGAELRILFNGSSYAEWAQHESDVAAAKAQAKQELGIEDE